MPIVVVGLKGALPVELQKIDCAVNAKDVLFCWSWYAVRATACETINECSYHSVCISGKLHVQLSTMVVTFLCISAQNCIATFECRVTNQNNLQKKRLHSSLIEKDRRSDKGRKLTSVGHQQRGGSFIMRTYTV